MSQTYPLPITRTMLTKAAGSAPLAKTVEKDPGISTGRNLGASYYEPDTRAEFATAATPDYVFATLMAIAANEPYATT